MPTVKLEITLQQYLNLNAALIIAIKHNRTLAAAYLTPDDADLIECLADQADLWDSLYTELHRQRNQTVPSGKDMPAILSAVAQEPS